MHDAFDLKSALGNAFLLQYIALLFHHNAMFLTVFLTKNGTMQEELNKLHTLSGKNLR